MSPTESNTNWGIQLGKPALALAPMEGVTDAPMRTLLTERGGFDFCVTEFLRITDQVYPRRVFYEHAPELRTTARTPSGTPVQVQILGGNEDTLALNARKAVRLGALGIDINFGCPSPTVNSHDGGATLLKYPERITRIVRAVRSEVPEDIPVSAKLRLGWENCDDIYRNAEAAILGGAAWLTIHARTKVQGYKPPAHWEYIGKLRQLFPQTPVVANGEIWTIEDFKRCQEITQCEHYMLGRGALADPNLVHKIAQNLGIPVQNTPAFDHSLNDWTKLLKRFAFLCEPFSLGPRYTLARLKQWLRYVNMREAFQPFEKIKRAQSLEEAFSILSHIAHSVQ